MRALIIAGFLFAALISSGLIISGAAQATDAPHSDIPFEPIMVRIEGTDYSFGYKAYATPLTLDLTQGNAGRDTPYHTLLSYYGAFARITDFDQVAPYLRKANGEPGEPPPDEAQHIAAAKTIFSGEVLIFGEIAFGDYLIYIYRYSKSIKRHLGLPLRKFGAQHAIVQDLIEHSPLARALSAARYDPEKLKAKHPAAN